ncbi:UDP-glucose 4-epimerase isoform X2 [Lepeophtheirus salmonis]|uniref:UDP-glucose 4-epimerase isoform X2 n=2 Tax=Lepeophtheirus salmonis TaxID=72036 RepID=UPI001AE9F9F6|nr:UDP-glucose 4-epimerase-like isoform X2 [Lepeophtheirus salmonis]
MRTLPAYQYIRVKPLITQVKMSGKGKTVLVTGAGGYVGSHCVLELLIQDYNIVAVDNFVNCVQEHNSYPESLCRVEEITGKTLSFHEADLTDKATLVPLFEKYNIDCVVHFAALKAVGESCRLPLMYYSNNVTGSANLMDLMMEYGVKKIVFSSSATVYGDPQYLPVDEMHPVGACTNPYGKTKYFMEEIMKDVCNANKDWGTMILRYFNPVGAHPSGKIGEDPQGIPNNLLPFVAQVIFLKMVAVGRRDKLTVYGNDYDTEDGTGVRDYIHIMDLAKGHALAINELLKPEQQGVSIYNLGTGKGSSVLQVIEAFEKASGKKIPFEFAARRPGDVSSCYAKCELAKENLNFKSNYSLLDMCKDMWTWQSQNPSGYTPSPSSK